MKKLLERIIALPLWIKVIAAVVALALITGVVALAVMLGTSDEGTKDGTTGGTSTSATDNNGTTGADGTDGTEQGTEDTDEVDDPTEEPTDDDPTEESTGDGGDEPSDESSEPDGGDEPTDPQPTDPQPTEPKPTDPQPTDPQPTDPQPTDPQPTDPQPTDPKPTDPQPTDPKPTESQPTEPKPTDPQPTDPDPEPPAPVLSAVPNLTVCTQVGPGQMVVAGTCAVDTEYIRVSGDGVTSVDIYPDKGSSKSYFIGTVKYTKKTTVNVQVKQPNKELSEIVKGQVGYDSSMPDYMTSDEYMPVFSKNSRMHFYSALLCYTLSNKVSDSLKTQAKNNITNIVNRAKATGTEVIYLVVPSSAWVYPETVPDEYKKATGETVYQAFKKVAEESGATVIYPLDTMLAHKNDGDGLKIYHNTDSHWSTYGAYWGLYDLMNYISADFPEAKPRSLAQMGFYTKEMYGGDALFSFPNGMGFDKIQRGSGWNGATTTTRLKELAPLYSITFGTNTTYSIFRKEQSVYIDQGNSDAQTVSGGGAGLPTAMVMRDSFGCTIFDMLSDRFSTVWWQDSGNYRVSRTLEEQSPDYLIYVISERNLTKVMAGNSNASITNLK